MDVPSCQGCRERDARIAELEARLAKLEATVQEQARLIVDLAKKLQDRDLPKSGTPGPPDTSKPPVKKPSQRKPGGQPGHPPHLKQMLPAQRVAETVPIVPKQCDHCQHTLPAERGPNDPEPTRFQVAELPEIKAKIIEYQGHARTCPCCGEVTRATIPAAVRAHSIGPGLAAFRRADDPEREQIFQKCPGLVYAYQIHERRETAPATTQFLQARLLAGQSYEYIAEEMSTLADTVRWYEALFFDVVEHLHRRDWIASMVLLPPMMQRSGLNAAPTKPEVEGARTGAQCPHRQHEVGPLARPLLDPSIKYFAYFGGPIVADFMIHGVQSGRRPVSQNDVARWLDEIWALTVKRRSLQAAYECEINKRNAQLWTAHAHIIELKGTDNTETQRSTVERHIRAMLDDVPWEGLGPSVPDYAIDKYRSAASTELRDDELLAGEAKSRQPATDD